MFKQCDMNYHVQPISHLISDFPAPVTQRRILMVKQNFHNELTPFGCGDFNTAGAHTDPHMYSKMDELQGPDLRDVSSACLLSG